MGNCWNPVALLGSNFICRDHEGRWVIRFEVLSNAVGENGGAERAEGLAVLDPAIQNVLHVIAAWVGQDAPVPQRTRAEFHPSLKPADDLTLGDLLHRAINQSCCYRL
jgi:hypothetical protein